jgi:hypothetical protein
MPSEVIERCRSIEGATVGEGVFAEGPAVWVGRREVAHIDADGAVDIRLTKQQIRRRRAELEADTRISLRAPSSDWLEVRVATDADIDFALTLIADAVVANLPSAPPGSPPTGSELDRRRRFH